MSAKRKPKTSESQRAAWRRWAEAHPEQAQANRNAWAQSPAGKEWLAKNQAKKNKRRDAWRKKKKAEKLAAKKTRFVDVARVAEEQGGHRFEGAGVQIGGVR